MAFTLSPNMNLPVPTVGVEPGPQYAQDINNSLTLLDGHDHSIGSGVQITPSGLNINSSLPLNGQSLISIGALTFQSISTDATNGSLEMKGVDLYYVDGGGNVIRITQSGTVAGSSGTITGLPSGTASASFAAGIFTFQAATSTAANIDGGSFILRNNTMSSFGLTLQPPNAMGADYSLTLPTVPAQTNVMTLDASGNMGSVTFDAVGQTMTSVGANAVANTRTRGVTANVGAVGDIAYTASSGVFNSSSTSFVTITNQSLTLTTSGRPVMLMLSNDGSSASSIDATGIMRIRLQNTFTGFANVYNFGATSASLGLAFHMLDVSVVGSTGTFSYAASLQAVTGSGQVSNYRLTAYEL